MATARSSQSRDSARGRNPIVDGSEQNWGGRGKRTSAAMREFRDLQTRQLGVSPRDIDSARSGRSARSGAGTARSGAPPASARSGAGSARSGAPPSARSGAGGESARLALLTERSTSSSRVTSMSELQRRREDIESELREIDRLLASKRKLEIKEGKSVAARPFACFPDSARTEDC